MVKNFDVDIRFNLITGDLETAKKELSDIEKKASDLQKQKLMLKLETDSAKLDETNSKIKELQKFLSDVKNPNVDVKVSDEEIQKAEKELQDLQGKKLDLEVSVADTELKIARKEVNDLNGEKVNVDVDVDDTSLKNARKELDDLQKQVTSNMSGTGSAVTGMISGLAGKSIWDTVYGTSAKAETNKVLIKGMGDTSESYTKLYNTIDKTTDSSLISMQQLIPAMNGIKSATGGTAKEMDTITPKVANFGQYVYAMTGSSAKAEQAMFDLSKGIKGAYASLDQYGITEDALMRTGLWNGKEDDVEGYMEAVNKVTGSTDDLMNTATGMEALMGKSFSRAGKRLGESVLPAVKTLLQGFNDLDAQTKGWLSTSLLVGGGIASSVVSGLSAISQAKQGYDALKGSIETVRGAYDGVKGAIDTVRTAESLSAGVKSVLATALGIETVAQEGNAVAKGSAVAPTTALSVAENSLLLPVLLLIGAILILVGVLWYLYNNNEQVREAVDGLVASLGVFVGQVMGAVKGAIDGFIAWLGDLYSWLSQLGTQVTGAVSFVITYLSGIINSIVVILSQIWLTVVNWFNMLLNMTPQQVLMLIIGVITTLNPFASLIAGVLSRVLPVFISQATSWITNTVSRARNLVNQVYSAISSLPSRVTSAVSGVLGALTRPFTQAWNTIRPIIDQINSGIDTVKSVFHMGFEGFEGFDEDISFEGFNESLNATLSDFGANNQSTVQNTFNINGIIEESASEYIVNSVNSHLKKQNLIRGR